MSQQTATAIDHYETHADALAEKWAGVSQDAFYAPVRHLIPDAPCRLLDLGAGPGLGARWFADLGHSVTAVEPVARFAQIAQDRDGRITWLQDALPELPKLTRTNQTFDYVNVAGVWHHLNPNERQRAAQVIVPLCAPAARLTFALRLGPLPPGLPGFSIDVDETAALFTDNGFSEIQRAEAPSLQQANRAAGVTWTWLTLQKEVA